MLLSVREYNRLTTQTQSFWDAHSTFAETTDLPHLAIDPQVFANMRDRSGGCEAS
jgi:hypothetical protein